MAKTCSLYGFCGHNPGDPTALATRALACFCDACMHKRWNSCINKAHVQPWDYHTLLPLPDEAVSDFEPVDEASYNDFTYKGHHDVLSSTLWAGNTFAVNPDAQRRGCGFLTGQVCCSKGEGGEGVPQ
ncbi:hypothetical protein L7F22_061505 [Adiantum nelumboides]|nr:hypothetical protein [Adiantum nelumboides]